MKPTTTARALFLLAASLAAAAAAPPTRPPSLETLLAADRDFNRDSATRGRAAWLDRFAPDVVIYPAAGTAVSGLDAVRASYEKAGFDPAGLTWEPVGGDIAASGDLGWTWGTWAWSGKDKDGKPMQQKGSYVTVWKQQPDGRWKIRTDIGTNPCS